MPLKDLPEPPSPPSAPRRIRLYRYQWVGLPLLALLPVLALAGVFGVSWTDADASSESLAVDVRYSNRYRYKQLNRIEVRVRNIDVARLDTVTVALDTALAARFSTVRSVPPFVGTYRTELTGLEPGEERLVVIELQAERYGRHEGLLEVIGPDTVALPLSIFIFP